MGVWKEGARALRQQPRAWRIEAWSMSTANDAVAGGGRRTRRSGRPRLSRRQVRALVTLGQWWEDLETGEEWRIARIHRGDGGRVGSVARHLAPLELEQADPRERRYLTFGELGGGYRLLEEGPLG